MSWQTYSALALVLTVALVLILQSWRRGIYFLFIWLMIEDSVRRLLPGQPVQVQLVKEILLLGTYIGFAAMWRKQGRLFWVPRFFVSLLAFSVIVLVDAFNPDIPGLLVPAVGIRSYLWYVPLLWIGYYAFKTKTELLRFSRLLLWAALPLGALGVMQYVMWDQLPLWLQPLEGAHAFHSAAFEAGGEIVAFESKLPSSVFGSAHRFAMFSLFLFFLGIGTWGLRGSGSRRRERLGRALSVLAPLVCIVVAGTRMGIGLAIVGLMLLAIEPVLTTRRGFLLRRVRLRRILASMILAGALFGILQAFSDTGSFFLHSTEGDVKSHWEQFTGGQLPLVVKEAAWLGFGTGTLSQGLTYVPGGKESFDFASRQSEGVGVEYGLAKIAWELGIAGLVLFLALWISIFWSLWKNLLLTRDSLLKGVARALAIFVLLVFLAFLKGHYYLGDGTTLAVCWFAMGLSFSFRRLERIETTRRSAVEAARLRSTRPLGFRQDIRSPRLPAI